MSSTNLKKATSGIWGLMFVIFFFGKVFELGQFAGWSWWWVTAPLWAPAMVQLGVGFTVNIVRSLFRMTAGLFK